MIAELFRLRTSRAARVASAVLLALHLLVQWQALGLTRDAVAAITPAGIIEIFTGEPRPAVPAVLDLTAGSSLQMCLFLPCLGALLGGLAVRRPVAAALAVPQRARLFAVQTAAVACWLTVVAVLVAAVSLAFTYLAVRDWSPGLAVSGAALAGQVRFVAYAVTYSLIGYALALAGRGTLAGLLGVAALTAVTMTQAAPARLDALFPLSAGRNLLLDPALGELTAGRVHAALVIAGWGALSLAGAFALFRRRDVR